MASLPDDELVKEVFAHFGLAAYLAQALERSLVNALTTVYGPEQTKLSGAQIEKRFEDLAESSPGTVLETLRDAGLSPAILPAVRAALNDRHRLTHRFFWDRAAEFMSEDGCHRMLQDLTAVQVSLGDCSARVDADVKQWAAAHGIVSEDFDAVHSAMVERGRVLSDAELDEVRGRRAT